MVPGLSSRAGEVHPPARGSVQHGLAPAGRHDAGGAGARAGEGVPGGRPTPAQQLLDLPPLAIRGRNGAGKVMRPIDLEALRTRLGGATGRQYWRSLEELADTPEFREMLHREFPVGASEQDDSV